MMACNNTPPRLLRTALTASYPLLPHCIVPDCTFHFLHGDFIGEPMGCMCVHVRVRVGWAWGRRHGSPLENCCCCTCSEDLCVKPVSSSLANSDFVFERDTFSVDDCCFVCRRGNID